MKRLWKSLAVSLGVMVTGARGQNATAPAGPAASIGRPVAGIGRPVVLNQEPVAPPVFDARVQPVSFDAASDPRGVARGSPAETVNASMFGWRPLQAEIGPQPQTAAPPLAGSVSSGPVVSGPVVGGDCTCEPNACCGWRWPLLSCVDSWFNGLGLGRSCCAADGCDGELFSDGCRPADRFFVRGEYLLWWTRGQPTPPLLTTSIIPAAPTFVIGSLADPNARVLAGNRQLGSDSRSGGRLQAGYWLTDDHLLGIDASAFFLGDTNGNFTATSGGSPLLFRPFLDAVNNIQSVQLVAINNGAGVNFLAGTFNAQNSSSLWGGDVNLRTNLATGPNFFLDGIVGFRYLSLDDSLNLQENLRVVNTFFDGTRNIVVPAGTTFLVNDGFSTKNRFYGGQIGLVGEYRLKRWVLGVDAKVGLGGTQQAADIIGSTSVNGGAPLTGGLLAQNSNIGHFSRDVFTVVPEIGLNVGYQLTPHCRAFVGYNFLWWSSVARAGNQIYFAVNTNKIPPARAGADTPNRPAFSFNGSDFWAQGLNVGLFVDW